DLVLTVGGAVLERLTLALDGLSGGLGERNRRALLALSHELPVAQLDVALGPSADLCSPTAQLVGRLLHRVHDRPAGDVCGAPGANTRIERRLVGVANHDLDLVQWNAQHLGDDLPLDGVRALPGI